MKLTVLGGGGFRVPLVYGAIAASDAAVRIDEIALYDVDHHRLGAISGVIEEMAGGFDKKPKLLATDDLDTALEGSDFIFSAIRVGGAEARIIDERVALGLGLLGQETIGPGGLAYALRTLPVMIGIAERIKAISPNAWVINFTNPAGIVTEGMRTVLGERVCGICDTPIGLLQRAAGIFGRTPDDVGFDYVGLNHLGWLRSLEIDGRDRLPEILADDSKLGQIEEARLMGFDWVRVLNSLPNEYLYYYYFNREARESITAAESTRGEFLLQQQRRFYQEAMTAESPRALWLETLREREATYMAESRQDELRSAEAGGGYQKVALDLMAALATGRRSTMILNVSNDGNVPELPQDAVIEVPCTVDEAGISRHKIAPVELDKLALMAPLKAAERLIIRAALTRDEDAAWQGFATHPLVDSPTVARSLLAEYKRRLPGVAALFSH